MTNLEKLKELKDYELAQVITMLNEHVETVEDLIDVTKTSINRTCASEIIVVSWLNEPYNQEKGFKFLISGNYEYVGVTDLGALNGITDHTIDVDALLQNFINIGED